MCVYYSTAMKKESIENTEISEAVGVTSDEIGLMVLVLLGLAMFFVGAGMRTYRRRGEPMLRGAMTGGLAACVIFALVFIVTATLK